MSDLAGVALGYEPPAADGHGAGRLWIAAGGHHVLPAGEAALARPLLAAVLELRPRRDARLVVLGADTAALSARERAALRARIGVLGASGDLISNLNGWENIALPTGFHEPRRLGGLAPQACALLEQFGAAPAALLARLPEEMSAFERKLVGYVRMRLGRPQLVLAEDQGGGPAAGFAEAYLADCPEGTYVQFTQARDGPG
jgi:predicted ABC-type transport system involved in lysophospholipase L1 biosynthesis ATPase subunit